MAAHEIAREIEAVRRDDARIVLGSPVVAPQRVRPAHRQLADLAVRDFPAFVVDELHFIVGTHGSPDRLQPNVVGIIETHERQHPLRHPEVFLDGRTRDPLLAEPLHLGLEPLSPALDDAHRREVVLADRRVVDPADEERGHHGQVGDAFPLDQREDVGGA